MEYKSMILVAFFVYINLIICVRSKYIPNACSSVCVCEGNSIDCRAMSLSRPPNINLGTEMESFDLSHNDIVVLNSSSFTNTFASLKHLNVSNNYLDTIAVNSFANLLSIEVIDLSRNRIQHLNDRLIESNTVLHTLILDDNFLTVTENQPLLRSQSLIILSMCRASITWIDATSFSELPLLEDVDLAFNLLQTVNPDTFSSLQQLRWLDLTENSWTCEESLPKMVADLRKRGIDVCLWECGVNDPPKMHENVPQRLQHFPETASEKEELDSAELQTEALCSTAENYVACLMISLAVTPLVLLIVFIFFAIIYFQITKLRRTLTVIPAVLKERPLQNEEVIIPMITEQSPKC